MQQKSPKKNSKTYEASINNYQLQMEIGRGSSGTCYRAYHKTSNETYAIKKIPINNIKRDHDSGNLREAMKEVNMLKSLNHKNIIKYHQSFSDQKNIYIVMQYASKGDLHSILKRRKLKQQFYQQKQIWIMAQQLLQALKYLHSNNIVHRDFKTLNIFVNQNNQLMVGDLGVSKIVKADLGLYTRVGTPLYLAPQIIKYQKYDFKADVWGLGCVLYILSTLHHPFQGKNIISLGQSIVNTEPKPIQGYSEKLGHLIHAMLKKDPTKRPSPQKLLRDYFHSINTKNQMEKIQQSKPSPQKIKYCNEIRKGQSPMALINSKNSINSRNNNINRSLRLSSADKTVEIEDRKRVQTNKFKKTKILCQKEDFIFNEKKEIKQKQQKYQQNNIQTNIQKQKQKQKQEQHNQQFKKQHKYIKISDLKPEFNSYIQNNPKIAKITSRPMSSMINRNQIKFNKQKQHIDNQRLLQNQDHLQQFEELNLDKYSKLTQKCEIKAQTGGNAVQLKNRYHIKSQNKINKIMPQSGTTEQMQTMKQNYSHGKKQNNFIKRPNVSSLSKVYYVVDQTQKSENKIKKNTEPYSKKNDDLIYQQTQLRDSNKGKQNYGPQSSKTQINQYQINNKFQYSQQAIIPKRNQNIKFYQSVQSQALKQLKAQQMEKRQNLIDCKKRPKSGVCGRNRHILKNPNFRRQQKIYDWQESSVIHNSAKKDNISCKHTRTQILKKPQIIFLG